MCRKMGLVLTLFAVIFMMGYGVSYSGEIVEIIAHNLQHNIEQKVSDEIWCPSGNMVDIIGKTFNVQIEERKNLFYLRSEANKWVGIEKRSEELNVRDGELNPDGKRITYSNSKFFLPYVVYPVGSWPEAVAIGDVNSDSLNDVVITTSFYFDSQNDYRIHVFLQNALGGFDPPVKYSTLGTYTSPPKSIDIGDLNNDGKVDVVVGNSGSNIGVFLQNNSGGLDPIVVYPTINSLSLEIGDMNNDGLLDVVGIGWGTNSVDVFLQNSSGTLDTPVTYSVTHGGYDEVEIGDVNNDLLPDIIVMSGQYYAYPNIGVLLQERDGFKSPLYYDLGINENAHGVAVGDINGDTLQDIVITYGGNRPYSFIGTFLQNKRGKITSLINYPSYDIPEAVEIGDVNSDGRNDIIVAHGGCQVMGVYRQSAKGHLSPEELYPLPYASLYNPKGLAVGDINGNLKNDVVIADNNNGLVVLYDSSTTTRDLTGKWSAFQASLFGELTKIKGVFTVKNISKEDAGKFKVGFYISNDTMYDSEDILIQTRTVQSLLARNTKKFKFEFKTNKYLHGKCIIARVDSDNQVQEYNKANNIVPSPQIE